ncbi:MAG: Holliday junction branch migration protein RuvA [Chloroflexi bacterium HGW-Chloroflexi-1]|nr:MAG: Holliday junction branch migration protein RuvA [Chloroflexi bacterium HGW-Chloroflexi-1]
MIATLEGRIAARTGNALVVTVGGIGLRVLCPQPLLTAARTGEPILLHTHLIVRADELALVGFGTEEELTLFKYLIAVPGVGPKVALSVLSAMAPDALRLAIGQEQHELLARIPGIGKKTAQKIVLELRDKVGAPEFAEGLAALTEADAVVIDALTALGYSIVEAQRAVQSLPRDVTDIEQRLRLALASFG